MQTTVRICGVDYPDCEVVEHGEHWGIKTQGKIFWVFLECDHDGNEITMLPPFLPREIRAVTNQVPDLTGGFPETVKNIFAQRLAYFTRTETLEQFLADRPNICNPPTQEEFTQGRKVILAQSLDEFRRTGTAQFDVWLKHGTREIADQHGYFGCRYGSTKMPVAATLRANLMNRRWPRAGFDAGWAAANDIVSKLSHVMIYDGTPKKRWIYLEGMKESPDVQGLTAVLRVKAVKGQKTEQKIELVCPDLGRLEDLTARHEVLEKQSARNIAERKKLNAEEVRLETVKAKNRTEEARLAQERAKEPVSHADCLAELKVGSRQFLNLLKKHRMDEPTTRRQLDVLLTKHQRRKKGLRESLGKRNKARAEERRGG
ncbi:MAG: hypothetical protein EXS31_06970 [Pedosphaera sp.]|nr:hypothetical protein [Pedosphaera sp.]